MKKLRFYLMLLVAVLATSAKAANVKYLVLNSGGEETVIALADSPVMTVNGGVLRVTVAGAEKVTATLTDGLSYRFADEVPNSILEAKGDEASRLEAGHVYIAGGVKGETVRVFGAGGRLLATQRIGEDGTADIDLTQLGKGLLIVKSSKTSIKVMNQ